MTRVIHDSGDGVQKEALDLVSSDVNFPKGHFPDYRIGPNNQIIDPEETHEAVPLKEIVAKETAQLLEQHRRLSVRDLKEKFEKGLSGASKLSEEEAHHDRRMEVGDLDSCRRRAATEEGEEQPPDLPPHTRKGGRDSALQTPALLWEGGSRSEELNGVWRRGICGDGGGGAMPHLARCPPISPRPAATGHAGEVLRGRELVFSAAAASSAGESPLTAALGPHPLQASSAAGAGAAGLVGELHRGRGVRRRPYRRDPPWVRGPPPTLQVSSAAGAGSAAGPAGELRRRRGVHRGDPIARLSSTKPALWETAQICVSHYAACIMPFALAKPGYPPMRATKHQRTALHKPG